MRLLTASVFFWHTNKVVTYSISQILDGTLQTKWRCPQWLPHRYQHTGTAWVSVSLVFCGVNYKISCHQKMTLNLWPSAAKCHGPVNSFVYILFPLTQDLIFCTLRFINWNIFPNDESSIHTALWKMIIIMEDWKMNRFFHLFECKVQTLNSN